MRFLWCAQQPIQLEVPDIFHLCHGLGFYFNIWSGTRRFNHDQILCRHGGVLCKCGNCWCVRHLCACIPDSCESIRHRVCYWHRQGRGGVVTNHCRFPAGIWTGPANVIDDYGRRFSYCSCSVAVFEPDAGSSSEGAGNKEETSAAADGGSEKPSPT